MTKVYGAVELRSNAPRQSSGNLHGSRVRRVVWVVSPKGTPRQSLAHLC